MTRTRRSVPGEFINVTALDCGLTVDMLGASIERTYDTLDTIDENLLASGSPRLSQLVELANLSSILGNLLASGIVSASGGEFTRAGPHKYQDLRSTRKGGKHIEIKVALEKNNPKGHLPKEGPYVVCRYVLGNPDGSSKVGVRGEVIWIWELRFGHLRVKHFNISNTAGDSGKTAVVNREGMQQLKVIYVYRDACPYGPASRYIEDL